MDTGCIAVVEHGDVTREAVDKTNLRFGECRSTAGYNVLNTRLKHGYDIHLSLHQVAQVLPRNSLFGEEESVQLVGLAVDDGVGRVDVFAGVFFLLEDTSGKGDGLARDGMDGEDDAVTESVV